MRNQIDNIWKRIKDFDSRSRRNSYIMYFLCYTLLFAVMLTCVFSWFRFAGKSFLWGSDGLYQHYNAFLYYSDYMKEILSSLFSSGKAEIPLWNFNIGLGGDIVQTLHYYAMGDPLTIFSVLVPRDSMEQFFTILIYVRFYLAGIAFACYGFRMKLSRHQVLTGATIYVFCGFALGSGIRHPYFMNPMIYFPFILIGIEKVFKKEKPFVFIISICIAGLSSFYFFYMLTILMFFYAAVRFFHYTKEHYIRNFFQTLGRFILYYATGILMACVLFLPMVLETLSGGRVGSGGNVSLVYDLIYYVKFWMGLTTIRWVGNGGYLGYTGLVLIAGATLLLTKKKHGQLKIGFMIGIALLMLPAGGYILHGFSYVSNRWVWGFSFLMAFITAVVLPQIMNPGVRLLRWIAALIVIYITPYYVARWVRRDFTIAASSMLLLFFILMLVAYCVQQQKGSSRKWIPYIKCAFTGLVMINILVITCYSYSEYNGNYVGAFHDKGIATQELEDNKTIMLRDVDDDEFYRYEEATKGERASYNTGLQNDIHGMSFYFSVANKYISAYMEEVENNISRSFKYVGMDGRAELHALAGGKYFITRTDQEKYLPYGYGSKLAEYEQETEEGELLTYGLYETENFLPLGYTYSRYMTEGQYQELYAIQKQQAMTQAVVLEDSSLLEEADELVFQEESIDYEIELGEGIEVRNGAYVVSEEEAWLELHFEQLPESELYLNLDGLECEISDMFSDVSKASIEISSGGLWKRFGLRTEDDAFYEGKSDYTFNLGYSEKGKNKIKISFGAAGTYKLDAINIICEQMDGFEERIAALREDTLEDVEIATNKVTGTISLDRAKALCFSIPYSEGWSARVDGEEAELKQANTMYMAVELTPGEHTVELTYETPGLKAGMAASGSGILLFLGVLMYQIRRRNVKK